MSEAVFLGLGLLVGGVAGWLMGGGAARKRVRAGMDSLLRELRSEVLSSSPPADAGADPFFAELRTLLAREWMHRNAERGDVTGEALGRMAEYLRHRVEAPLLEGLKAGGGALRTSADAALGAVEDLEFFLEDPSMTPHTEPQNLGAVVSEVTREFTAQSDATVKLMAPSEPLRARMDPERFKDAVFLILHNAWEFGGGGPVEVTLARDAGKALVKIRDRGPGFSADALLRAFDPFYSTSPAGLGLGLPHARRAIRSQGGEINLRNPQEGGAEVEVVLPLA